MVAYGALVPRVALDVPRAGWVNLHFSLLPAWRGAAPVQAAVLHGDEVTGATTFRLEEGLDTGPVFGVVTEPIRPRDTTGDLLQRLSVSGAALLVATLDGIEDGTLVARPQPAEGVSAAPKLTVEDVRVDWAAPAPRVDRLVRAATPAPGAWTTYGGDRLKLGPVLPVPDGPPLAPGELARRAAAGAGRHRHHAGRAGRGARHRQAADAGRGLGPGRAPRTRRTPRRPRSHRRPAGAARVARPGPGARTVRAGC